MIGCRSLMTSQLYNPQKIVNKDLNNFLHQHNLEQDGQTTHQPYPRERMTEVDTEQELDVKSDLLNDLVLGHRH